MPRRPTKRPKAQPKPAQSPQRRKRVRKAKPIPDYPRKPAPAPVAAPPAEDPVVAAILDGLSEAASLSPRDIAQRLAAERAKPGDPPDAWRRYFTAVKQHAVNLARTGKIEIVRKGEVVDPSDFKGIVRYRLARGGSD